LLLLLGSLTPLAAAPVGLVELLELVGISDHFYLRWDGIPTVYYPGAEEVGPYNGNMW
jgi:hypothetical protein